VTPPLGTLTPADASALPVVDAADQIRKTAAFADPPRDAAGRRPVGRRVDAVASPVAPITPGPPPDAPPPSMPAVRPAPARLELSITPWCVGTIAGRSIRTPVTLELPAGTYLLDCAYNQTRVRESITLSAGESKRFEKRFLSPVSVTTSVPIRFAGGRTYRPGDRFVIEPGRYRVDVLSGDRESGAVNISRPCRIGVDPELGCY
jgi:hypothetical protein